MKPNKLIIQQLKTSEVARNNHKEGYIEYIMNNYCDDSYDRLVIKNVLSKAITWSWYVRQVAFIQNNLWIYKPNEEVKKKRSKQEVRIREEFSKPNLFNALATFFKKL